MISIKLITSFTCKGPRPNQEDYVIGPNDTSSRVFVLCDGMGGHGHGEIASKTVAESVYGFLTQLNPTEYTEENLQDAVDFALKELVVADIYDDEKAMGTTIVVVVINQESVLVGHIGDSRCYLFSADGIKKFRTKDHSKVQEAVDAEILTEEEAWSNPQKNILTRCITSKQSSLKIEVDKLRIEDNDCILVCSDGITDALRDSQLQSIVIGRSILDATEIIKTECEMSSRDNFSLILISLSQDKPNSPVYEPRNDDVPTNDIVHNTALDHIFCSYCGMKLNFNAKFCPSCGNNCTNDNLRRRVTKKPDSIVHTISEWLRNFNPYYLVIGGIAVGSIISCLLITCLKTSEAHGHNLVNKPFKNENVVPIPLISSLISNLCSVDTINAPNDTIISKQRLSKEYQSFIEDFQNNAE